MSSKTLYYCDQCKKEVKSSGELTHIKLELDPYSNHKTDKFEKVYQYYDICSECTEKLGFTKRKIQAEKVVIESTTADKLYEIVAQMISEQTHKPG